MDTRHIKEIKRRLREQLKSKYSGHRSFSNNDKKRILSSLLKQVIDNYDLSQPVNTDKYELCGVERIPGNIYNLDQKENRAFIGLTKKDSIHHSQLSKFRSSLSYATLINVMVYFIYVFLNNKKLSKNMVYAVDSTELAEKIRSYPLVKMKFNGQEIRLYQDIDADCGSRRPKRDKSRFIIGYRLHTLTVIDPETQKAYPLLSILASANHHDSQ